MSTKLKLFFAFLLFCSAMANAYAADGVRFTKLSLPVTPGVNGAAFMTVTSRKDDSILSASSACCEAVELHTHNSEKGIMRMRRVDSVTLKADEPTLFKSGGLHVMLIGIKEPLQAGEKVPVTFTFEQQPPQTVVFTADGSRLPADAHSSNHH